MLTPAQIEMRRNGIGSSDVPAICDLYPDTWKNKRRRPDDVFREKMGEATFLGSARTERGDWLEPIVAERWSKETGRAILRNAETAKHPTIPWALATCDFFVVGPPREILEIKLVGKYGLKSWANGPPTYVEAQVQYQLGCLGLEAATVAALFEGDDECAGPRPYPVKFKPEAFDHIVTICGAFWDRVLSARVERERKVSNG